MFNSEYIESLSERKIINLVIDSKDNITYKDLNKYYFSHSIDTGANIYAGVVETPNNIIDYMIELAIAKSSRDINSIEWYDPCSGSGKFIVRILIKIINNSLSQIKYYNLPCITFCELSKYGFYISLLNIKKVLEDNKFSFKSYITSGRLKAYLGDALEINSEAPNSFSKYNICADIVIGNPPYVRSTKISQDYKCKLQKLYPSTYNGSEDLYSYFYIHGINSLANEGVLCFISPASFFKKSTSKLTRKYLSKMVHPKCIVDLDENEVFDNIKLHTSICCLKKQLKSTNTEYYHAKNKNQVNLVLNNNIKYLNIPSSNFGVEGWFIEKHNISELNTIKLKDVGLKVRSGVRTGNQDAFVYSIDELYGLPDELVKPALNAKSIIKWQTVSYTKKLLFMTNDTKNFHEYALTLLEKYKEKLISRSEVKKNDNWMLLRPCSYYNQMLKPKIVFPDITSSPKFSLDKTASFILDGAFLIDSNDKCLLGILNSKLAWQYFKSTCSSIGNVANKGRLRLKKIHVDNFPLPKNYLNNSDLKHQIEKIVDEILLHGETKESIELLNQYVSNMYKKND